jgi:NADH pyrophosphatase NudC (nudix superfamily)
MQLDQIYASYDWREKQGIDKFKYCPLCGTQFRQEQVAQKIRPLCPNCGFIYYRNPFPTVSVLVVKNDTILLGKRLAEPGKGKWALPSGYIEFEDDFLTAAVREVKEETGLDVEIISILNVQSAFLPAEHHFLNIYLLARVTGGRLHSQDDLENANWFSLSEPLPEMAFIPDIDIIQAYSNGEIEGITVKRNLCSDVQ